jgi:hypothetical protein
VKPAKIAYRPVGFALGILSGALAGGLFSQIWKRVAGDDDAPEATDEDRHWSEILLAAALQGAIFATVKAAVGRAGATATRRLTGAWPG